jgi:archaellin
VVAAVFATTVLSAGLFSADKSREAIDSGLLEVQGTLELRGDIVGYRDTLNTSGKGSLGKLELTVTVYSDGSQVDLTQAYTIAPGTGALSNSNPKANKLQIAFSDQDVSVSDCAWTAKWIGRNNGDNMLDPDEKAVITVWLHSFDGTNWSSSGPDAAHFLGTNYVDTYHTFTMELVAAKGAVLSIQRTTPAYLDPVISMH